MNLPRPCRQSAIANKDAGPSLLNHIRSFQDYMKEWKVIGFFGTYGECSKRVQIEFQAAILRNLFL